MKQWMINEGGDKTGLFDSVSFDPNKYSMTLNFNDMKVTYQAIDINDYKSMELLIDRFMKDRPGLVMLPLCSQVTRLPTTSSYEFDPLIIDD